LSWEFYFEMNRLSFAGFFGPLTRCRVSGSKKQISLLIICHHQNFDYFYLLNPFRVFCYSRLFPGLHPGLFVFNHFVIMVCLSGSAVDWGPLLPAGSLVPAGWKNRTVFRPAESSCPQGQPDSPFSGSGVLLQAGSPARPTGRACSRRAEKQDGFSTCWKLLPLCQPGSPFSGAIPNKSQILNNNFQTFRCRY